MAFLAISNLEKGSHYALIDSMTGEVVKKGVAEFPDVNLHVKPGTYDIRVRHVGLLPFQVENFLVNRDSTFVVVQTKDNLSEGPESESPNKHQLFDEAMYLLFAVGLD